MRIGILTFHHGNNYGGVLQCYATQQLLLGRGHKPEVINYVPPSLTRLQLLRRAAKQVHSLGSFVHFVLECGKRVGQKSPTAGMEDQAEIRQKFDAFRRERLLLSPPLDAKSIGEYANAHYDAIIVGSDQVWTSLYDMPAIYFLEWLPSFRGRRLSYAACSAHDCVSPRRRPSLAALLSRFDVITVRDDTTARLVQSLTGSTPQIVPDPTVLWPFEEMTRPVVNDGSSYILAYILGDEIKGGHEEAIRKIKEAYAEPMEVRAVVIPSNSHDIVPLADHVYYSLRPEEWVGLIAHARHVYTDSFHAVMFSLKFSRPFTAYYRNPIRATRMLDLRQRLGLASIVRSVEEIRPVPCPANAQATKDYFAILEV